MFLNIIKAIYDRPIANMVLSRKKTESNQESNLIYNSLKKYLGINLTKEMKNLNNENYETLK
jgi:hypothetical protein